MTESQQRRHGLETLLSAALQRGAATTGIQIQSALAHINLRGNAGDKRFIDTVARVLDQKLPTEPNTTTVDNQRVYWLGPDEWLILTELDDADTLLTNLRESLAGMSAAVNDVSGGQVALRVTGPHVAEILAKGCTLDLHPAVFPVGMCAQSGLAKASVLIGHTHRGEQQDIFDIVVRRSFADYLLRWLDHASREHGVTYLSS